MKNRKYDSLGNPIEEEPRRGNMTSVIRLPSENETETATPDFGNLITSKSPEEQSLSFSTMVEHRKSNPELYKAEFASLSSYNQARFMTEFYQRFPPQNDIEGLTAKFAGIELNHLSLVEAYKDTRKKAEFAYAVSIIVVVLWVISLMLLGAVWSAIPH